MSRSYSLFERAWSGEAEWATAFYSSRFCTTSMNDIHTAMGSHWMIFVLASISFGRPVAKLVEKVV